MRPPIQDYVKRPITSLRSSRLIDHNLEDFVNVPIQLSLPLSPLSLLDNDSTYRDATDDTPTNSSPSRPINLVDPKETNQDESKEEDDTSQSSTVE